MKIFRLLIAALFLFAAAYAVTAQEEKPKGEKPKGGKKQSQPAGKKFNRPPPPVETAKAIEKELSETIPLFGNVHSARSATVRAEVQGAVIEFHKEVGDSIKDGEAVAHIDSEKYRISMEIAEAALERAKAAFEKARLDEDRMTTLYKKNVMSMEEAQAATLNRKMAEADVTLRKVEVKSARRDLNLTKVRAPFPGYLAKKYLQKGDWVRAGDPVFDIVDLSSVYVSAEFPEKELSRVSLNSSATVRLDAYPEVEFKGKLTRIAPRASLESRGFMVRVEFNDPNGIARDGLFARVEILSRRATAIMVSKDAIVERGPMKIVFKVEDGTVRQINVSVLQQMGDMVEIKGGLKAGDEVVVTGNEILRDGARVNVTIRR